MSRESTSLKKASSDFLKLAKQWYSIWVKWCYFWTTASSQVVQKHKLGVVGNNSIYWFLTLSVTHVPNIMKIRQCFLELRLKISGMFFATHSSWLCKAEYDVWNCDTIGQSFYLPVFTGKRDCKLVYHVHFK